jgi:hypothetical protein
MFNPWLNWIEILMGKQTKSQWDFGAIRAPGRMGRPAGRPYHDLAGRRCRAASISV